MGRWLSPDPLFGKLIAPQTLNRYTYVLNNPLRYIDPLGLLHCKVTKGKDGKEQTSDCVSDDDYNKNKDKYPDHKKVTRQEEVTVTADGTSTQAKPWHSYTVWIAGVPRRLRQTRYLDLNTKLKIIADAMPTMCGGGVFFYGGVQGEKQSGRLKGAEGFAGGLAEWDSNSGWSFSGLFEAGGSKLTGGAAVSSNHFEPLLFVPAGELGGLVGGETGAGAYVGTPPSMPLGIGGGAYVNITTNGQCNQIQGR